MVGNSKRSPRFIKAKSEKELQKKILLMQLHTYKEYAFISIYPVKGGVVAWYYSDTNLLEEAIKETKNVS